MTLPPNDPRRPLVERVPPPNLASPSELRPRDPKDMRWYKPTFGETLALMKWRWIYFLPAIGLLLLVILFPVRFIFPQLLFLYWKLIVIAVAVPMGVFVKAVRTGIRMRTEPFCIHCGYGLSGLPDHYNCPECGEPFELRWVEEYRRDPHWFIERFNRRGEIPVADVPFEARKSNRKKSRDGT